MNLAASHQKIAEPARTPFIEHIIGAPQSIRRNQFWLMLALFVPLIGLFIIIRVVPIVAVLATSFTNLRLRRGPAAFVGLDNFVQLLDDDFFKLGLATSGQFVLGAVPLEIALGLLLAVLLSRVVRFEGLYQTLYFLPYILPMVPASIIWKWIYAPGKIGLANYLLDSMGLNRVGWLSDPNVIVWAIVIFHVWKQLGFFVIVFLVGLKAIPSELREAAACDGAGEWQTVRFIDLPLLKPIILFGVVMGTIWAWSIFTEIYIMTKGTDASAGTDMHVIVTRIYEEGFAYDRIGYASAISLVLFAVSLLFVAVQFWLLRDDDESRIPKPGRWRMRRASR
jgi:multiple sugar transport system permease protein